MIAVIDYGVGNIGSVLNALKKLGYEAKLTSNHDEILTSDVAILPGVGAFNDAITSLKNLGLDKTIYELVEKKKKIIAICIGMQLLCEGSMENGFHEGLGIFKGVFKRFDIPGYKAVEMGFNQVEALKNNINIEAFNNKYFYFVHSYYIPVNKDTLATTNYGIEYSAILHKDNIYAFQFHPEKSGSIGLNLLRSVIENENNTCN